MMISIAAAAMTATATPSTPRFPGCVIDSLPPKDTAFKDDILQHFTRVEVEASFPGGEQEWLAFVGANLKAKVPVKRKAPVGQYTVVVQFIVNTDGRLVDIKLLTNYGYGMEEEVVRVIRKSPRWSPAVAEGRTIKAYRKQPIIFEVTEK